MGIRDLINLLERLVIALERLVELNEEKMGVLRRYKPRSNTPREAGELLYTNEEEQWERERLERMNSDTTVYTDPVQLPLPYAK